MALEVHDPLFFETPAEWNDWLKLHHADHDEVWVGFYRKDSGIASMTWSQAVDEALCWGWIDGICKKLDAIRYVHRFTPRRPKSNWSNVNIAKVEMLTEQGRMRAPGLAAYARRQADQSGVYSFEQTKPAKLALVRRRQLKANRPVADFFARQTQSYQRTVIHWIEGAKQEATRERRFTQLVKACQAELLLKQFAPGRNPAAAKKK